MAFDPVAALRTYNPQRWVDFYIRDKGPRYPNREREAHALDVAASVGGATMEWDHLLKLECGGLNYGWGSDAEDMGCPRFPGPKLSLWHQYQYQSAIAAMDFARVEASEILFGDTIELYQRPWMTARYCK